MKKLIIGVLFLVAAYFIYSTYSSLETNKIVSKKTDEKKMMKPGKPKMASYTLEEVSKHNSKGDCWFVVEGKVYNVTDFIASGRHPGRDTILEGCGKDATELFNSRPMGSGTPHSDRAKKTLSGFEIGVLSP